MKKEKKVFYTPKDEVERYNIGSIDLLNYNNGGCLMFEKLEKSGRFFKCRFKRIFRVEETIVIEFQ